MKDEPSRKNATMWPLSDSGPYYAALVTGGTLDTKGGPKTSTDGKVLDNQDKPIPGLYGVGNCVASASGGAYWAGGATLGPILAFAYRAANAANAEPIKKSSFTHFAGGCWYGGTYRHYQHSFNFFVKMQRKLRLPILESRVCTRGFNSMRSY
ncbi:FAD-binding protein [Undibacterium arcticum]